VEEEGLLEALSPVLAIGREQGLSAYDASYLELAARRGLPLATQDGRLSLVATRVGVPLVS
jgi:predicted nucleic acid-binding protein